MASPTAWNEREAERLRAYHSTEKVGGVSLNDFWELNEYEELRTAQGWPTPDHLRRTADALDELTPARYGDVLRWFADKCDET